MQPFVYGILLVKIISVSGLFSTRSDAGSLMIACEAKALMENAIYHKTQTEKNQIRLITDSRFVLTGILSGNVHDTCLYSGQQNLVDVMKEALKNKIELLGK